MPVIAALICELRLLTRPAYDLITMEKRIYFPFMHSRYCYDTFYKYVSEKFRFVGWMLMDSHYII